MSTELQVPPTSLALTVPPDFAGLAQNTSRFVTEANGLVVDSEPTFQLADDIQDTLKREAKQIDDQRKEFTRPMDALKKKWMDFFKPAVDGRTEAVTIIQGKMSAYSRAKREEAEAAQREAERLARIEREKLEAEARKREEDATKLKTEAGREKALRDAEELRQTAQMMPTEFAVSAETPKTTASSASRVRKGRVANVGRALAWLVDHPEWQGMVSFGQADLNRLATQFGDTEVPGFAFTQEDSYRAKGR